MIGENENHWGCPDWRNKDAYPADPEEVEDWEWRWHFVRRHPRYRKLWIKRDPKLSSIPQMGWLYLPHSDTPKGMFSHDDWQELSLDFGFAFWFFDPNEDCPMMSDDSLWIDTLKLSGYVVDSGPGNNDIPTIDQMAELLQGREADDLLDLTSIVNFFRANYKTWRLLDNPRFSLATFDLAKPLDTQIEQVKQQLIQTKLANEIQTEQLKSNRRQHWCRHLRVIDAKDQGATHAEIYEQFAAELAGDDEEAMDEFYRQGKQPNSVVSQWLTQAVQVMEKASRFL